MSDPILLALRPVNSRIGYLADYLVSEVCIRARVVGIQFASRVGRRGFCVLLEEVIHYVDHGLVGQPLSGGVVWRPVGPFGREAAARLGLPDVEDLLEFRLDCEDQEGLHCRFQAIAMRATAWAGALDQGRNRPPQPSGCGGGGAFGNGVTPIRPPS